MRKYVIIALAAGISAAAQTAEPDSLCATQLGELTVSGDRPQLRGRDGIMVVDLPAIVSDKPVTNVLEALGYLPGVTNNNGMIWLAGASNVTIILNGELTNMPLQNLYQLLYTTPVDRLKTVEIMYSAPAKYHVSGAVINVVLKTPSPLDGLQGQLRAGYNQAYYGSYGSAMAATYAVGGWTFDVNYALSRSRSRAREEAFSNHLYEGKRVMIEDDMLRTTRNWSNTIYAAVGWKELRLTYNGQIVSNLHNRSFSRGTLGNYSNLYDYDSPVNYHNIALRYTTPRGTTVGGDYTRYSEMRSQTLYKASDLMLASQNRQGVNRGHIYVDRQHRLGSWQLNYGAEYQHSADNSSQHYSPGQMADFDNTLREDVAGFYVGTQRSFDWGLSFNLSAKGEYFHNNYRHNWNFIPQLGATYYRTPQNIFQLNLTTERKYPSYWELHGATSYINDYSMVLGNPSLQPYIDYSAQFNYILKQKYVATLYLQYAHKATVQLPYQAPDALQLVYQTINMNYKRTAGLNIHAPFSAGHIWSATATANVFNQREKADHFHDISFDNSKWVFYGALSNTLSLGSGRPLSLTVDVSYISPSLQGIADLSGMWRIDAGLKWRFGAAGCCEVDLRADDILNRWSPVMTISRDGQDYRMKVHDMTRNLKLTFIWRFNGFKPKDTTIDTSRFGTGK